MSTSRRLFVAQSLLSAGALAGGLRPSGALFAHGVGENRQPRPLRLLILGGTGFIGPYQVRYAVQRGHTVTVFNRGRRQADLPPSVEQLQGDRNGQLDALRGRKWDVVIDNPTTLPKWVRDVGAVLRGNVDRYVFVSTASVYEARNRPGMDETAPLARYAGADPFAEARVTPELYGPLKVVAEQEAERQFPGRAAVVRPTLIVGPGDPTDRFTYWPARLDRGGEVLAPGAGADPVQFVDARDFAEWTIRLCEQGDVGTYNVAGPRSPLTTAEFLHGCRAAVDGTTPVAFTWVPTEFLEAQQVRPWSDLPVWIPVGPENAGSGQLSSERAVAKGLTFRALADTLRDTLAWHRARPADQRATMRAGLTAAREREVLAAWKARAAASR
jgi:2'-hydroxyisoflavone reductase